MFTTLKNKIKEETGKEVAPPPVRMAAQGRLQRSAFGSTSSQFAEQLGGAQLALEQKDVELAALRLQGSEASARLDEAARLTDAMRKDIERLEQSNQLLEESLKVAQSECGVVVVYKYNENIIDILILIVFVCLFSAKRVDSRRAGQNPEPSAARDRQAEGFAELSRTGGRRSAGTDQATSAASRRPEGGKPTFATDRNAARRYSGEWDAF